MRDFFILRVIVIGILVVAALCGIIVFAMKMERISAHITPAKAVGQLPVDAENIREIGNDWLYFELVFHGNRHAFIFRRTGYGYATTECVTEIGDGWPEQLR